MALMSKITALVSEAEFREWFTWARSFETNRIVKAGRLSGFFAKPVNGLLPGAQIFARVRALVEKALPQVDRATQVQAALILMTTDFEAKSLRAEEMRSLYERMESVRPSGASRVVMEKDEAYADTKEAVAMSSALFIVGQAMMTWGGHPVVTSAGAGLRALAVPVGTLFAILYDEFREEEMTEPQKAVVRDLFTTLLRR